MLPKRLQDPESRSKSKIAPLNRTNPLNSINSPKRHPPLPNKRLNPSTAAQLTFELVHSRQIRMMRLQRKHPNNRHPLFGARSKKIKIRQTVATELPTGDSRFLQESHLAPYPPPERWKS